MKGSGGSLNIWIKKLEKQEKTTNQPDFSACLKLHGFFRNFCKKTTKQQEYAPTTTQHDGPHSERPLFFCYDYFSYLGLSAKKDAIL